MLGYATIDFLFLRLSLHNSESDVYRYQNIIKKTMSAYTNLLYKINFDRNFKHFGEIFTRQQINTNT